MEIKCLIIDDEPLAQDVIENFIATMPILKLVGKCDNAIEAITFLHHNHVDLLFLDLNMPGLSGLDMLKTLTKAPKVILTTAYSEYALESYEYGVVDYLLKPIKLERFIRSVNKVVELLSVPVRNEEEKMDTHSATVFIKDDQVAYQLNAENILYVEAFGNYLKVHTSGKVYVTRETMHDIEKKLPGNLFMRVHKSYIVNFSKIQSISGNRVFIQDQEIPIGEMFKLALKQKIN